jgi:hypothetical protein
LHSFVRPRSSDHADAANADRRTPAERSRGARPHRAIDRAALGDTAFDCLYAKGGALRDADIAALAFGEDITR